MQERIEAQIQKKIEGEEITVPEGAGAPASAKVIDIMDALRASLNRKGSIGSSEASSVRKPSVRKAGKQPEEKKAAKKVADQTAKKSSGRTQRKAA